MASAVVPPFQGPCETLVNSFDCWKLADVFLSIALRTVLEVSDHEDESGDPLEQDGPLLQNTDDGARKTRANSAKPPARRKRSQDFTDVDVDEAAATRKRRKSVRPVLETAPHVHRDWFHRRNGHGQWYIFACLPLELFLNVS